MNRVSHHAAFERIYERFAATVHGIVVAYCGARDAEDIAQEVFLVIHAKLGTLEDGDALAGWICTIARNAAIDERRRRQRRPKLEVLPELPAREQRDDGALAAHVLERVRELPDAFRETLVLRLVEGMSGPEIAAATGKTHGSVRVNLHRGMTMLRDALREDGWR